MHLLLIGDGQLRKDIEKKVHELSMDSHVTFLGTRTDVNELLSAADVFLFPSIHEGLPMSLLEAQCSGLPCVISDRVPQEACLTDLVCRLSLSADVKDWADAIIHSAAMQRNRQSYAQQIADAGYDIEENAQWLQTFYLSP